VGSDEFAYREAVEKCDKRMKKCDHEVKRRVKELTPKIRESGFGERFKEIFGHDGKCAETGHYVFDEKLKKFIKVEDQPQ